jgi:hypothetical protein
MNSNNKGLLALEVLEDRLALNSGFRGAIMSTPLNVQPIPGWTTAPPFSAPPGPGFRGSFVDFNIPPISSVLSFQTQFQAYQASQIALIDQVFSQMASLLQQYHL